MDCIDDLKIESINDLLKFIKDLKMRFSKRLWYRGATNFSWDLIPSVQRNQKSIDNERYLTNDFYIRAKQVLSNYPDKHDYAGWLTMMQHYGLPTRLLDWSLSPLVALFFASEDSIKRNNLTIALNEENLSDGCLWVLKPRLVNMLEGFGNCIFPSDADTAQEMLLPAFKERGYINDVDDKILACNSVGSNLRMYSQQSCFTIHNSTRSLTSLPCNEQLLYKVRIPSYVKGQFIEDLESFGITECFVYPDADHISHDLKYRYGIK